MGGLLKEIVGCGDQAREDDVIVNTFDELELEIMAKTGKLRRRFYSFSILEVF